jgi:hypothetical protein
MKIPEHEYGLVAWVIVALAIGFLFLKVLCHDVPWLRDLLAQTKVPE